MFCAYYFNIYNSKFWHKLEKYVLIQLSINIIILHEKSLF